MRLDLTPDQREELDLLLRKEIVLRRSVLEKLWEKHEEAKAIHPVRASFWRNRIRLEEEGKDTLEKIQRQLVAVAGEHIR